MKTIALSIASLLVWTYMISMESQSNYYTISIHAINISPKAQSSALPKEDSNNRPQIYSIPLVKKIELDTKAVKITQNILSEFAKNTHPFNIALTLNAVVRNNAEHQNSGSNQLSAIKSFLETKISDECFDHQNPWYTFQSRIQTIMTWLAAAILDSYGNTLGLYSIIAYGADTETNDTYKANLVAKKQVLYRETYFCLR